MGAAMLRHRALLPLGLLVLAAAPALGGCSFEPAKGVGMQDSLTLDLFAPPVDELNTPYVAGAKFDVTISSNGYGSMSGWTVVSSDPSVIAVGAANPRQPQDFPVTAAGSGHATLSVLDASGKVLDSHPVDVDEPDSVQLHAHGLMMAGMDDSQTQVTHASVVEGGRATFLVRYFKGSQELWGNGAVQPAATGSVTVTTKESGFGDARDWIELDAAQAGSGQVSLGVGGQNVATVPVDVVGVDQVARVTLYPQSESGAKDGAQLYVFARALDAQGGDVWGGSFDWAAGGAAVTSGAGSLGGPTDLLAYTYEHAQSESVSATLGTYSSSATVHGNGATLDTSANVGCAVARGAGTGGGAGGFALLLGAAGVVAARRRRGPRS
jgi:hypothetical protein